MAGGATIWVGAALPDGLDARLVATLAEVGDDAGTVVFEQCPPLGELGPLLSRDVAVVVCVSCSEPWSVRAWSEEGAYCLCREHHAGPALVQWLTRVRQDHQATTATRLRRLAGRIDSARFSVATLEDAEALAEVLAHLLPDSMRRLAGIVELLVNAVEHGNLGITGPEKKALLRAGTWTREITRRATSLPWSERVVRVSFTRDAREWTLVIEDEGDGFTPSHREDATALHGRGVSMARAAFDSVEWEGRGNRVVAKVRRHD